MHDCHLSPDVRGGHFSGMAQFFKNLAPQSPLGWTRQSWLVQTELLRGSFSEDSEVALRNMNQKTTALQPLSVAPRGGLLAPLFYPGHRWREASIVHFDTQLLVSGGPELCRREWPQDPSGKEACQVDTSFLSQGGRFK